MQAGQTSFSLSIPWLKQKKKIKSGTRSPDNSFFFLNMGSCKNRLAAVFAVRRLQRKGKPNSFSNSEKLTNWRIFLPFSIHLRLCGLSAAWKPFKKRWKLGFFLPELIKKSWNGIALTLSHSTSWKKKPLPSLSWHLLFYTSPSNFGPCHSAIRLRTYKGGTKWRKGRKGISISQKPFPPPLLFRLNFRQLFRR